MAGGSDSDDLQSKAAEMIRRALTVGIGAIFLTEESLRSLMSEFKLPKEILSGLLESAGKTRKEFLDRFSQDLLTRVMDRVEPEELMRKILDDYEFKFDVRVTLNRKQD